MFQRQPQKETKDDMLKRKRRQKQVDLHHGLGTDGARNGSEESRKVISDQRTKDALCSFEFPAQGE